MSARRVGTAPRTSRWNAANSAMGRGHLSGVLLDYENSDYFDAFRNGLRGFGVSQFSLVYSKIMPVSGLGRGD